MKNEKKHLAGIVSVDKMVQALIVPHSHGFLCKMIW